MKLSSKELIFSSVATSLFLASGIAPVQALTLKTFTDESEFAAIASGLNVETFNDATLSDEKNHSLTDFDIESNMTWSRIVDGSTTGNLDGSPFLRLQSRNPDTAAAFNFKNSINAFGFDWANTDSNFDVLELIIGNQSLEFGAPGESGFFGVIATDGDFSSVQFSDTEGGGYLLYGIVDNVRYGTVSPQAVPTPAAVLPNLAMFGLNLLRKRGDR